MKKLRKWIIEWLGVDELLKRQKRNERRLDDYLFDLQQVLNKYDGRSNDQEKRLMKLEIEIGTASRYAEEIVGYKDWWSRERINFLKQAEDYINAQKKK
jgi:hypothetical protein